MGTFNSTGSGGNWTDDSTWAETGQPAADGNDHVIITSGDTVTLTGNVGTGSLRVNGTLEGNYTVTLNDGGQSAILHNNGTINDTPNFTITGGTNREIKNDSSSTLGTVTINSSGQTFTLAGPNTHTYEALTITAGTLTTLDGSTSRNLTVTGDVSITGTLTGNASAITIGKMLEITNGGTYTETSGTTLISGQPDGDYVLRNHDGGTYTKHATGILKIARTSASGTKYAKFGEDVYNDVELENSASGSVVAIVGVMNLAGDLTIVEGELRTYGGTGAIDVDGHVEIQSGGKFSTETSQLAAGGVNADFGSLQINSGGTYDATPLTTTITSRTGGGYSWYAPTTGSIFNHNNGTVKLTYTGNETFWQGTGFYNLEIAGSTHYEHRYDDLTDGSGLTVYNNFTITEGRVRFNQAGDSVTVHGLTKMVGGQYCNTGTAPSGTHNYGNVVIEGGTWKLTSGTCNMSGIRKLGGTLS